MNQAAKHFDPQLGIDIHLYEFPPLPTPIPLPTPHLGIVLDPFDYIPFIGGTVQVDGVKRATAGTGGIDVHIPLGLWVPPLSGEEGPQFTDELFMGSATVIADGSPFSRIGMPVLDCNIFGLIPPIRPRKPEKPHLSMMLPTALNLAIPSTVQVGGPPTISMSAMAFHAAGFGLGMLKRTKAFARGMERFKGLRKKLFGEMKPGFLKCKVLRAEPVDIRSGAVDVQHEDFVIPGRLPLAWPRLYRSDDADRDGLCGHGWHTPADIRLELEPDGSLRFHAGDGRVVLFPELPALPGPAFAVLEWVDGARLMRCEAAGGDPETLAVRTKDGLVHRFETLAPKLRPLREPLVRPLLRLEDRCDNHWTFERVDGRLVRIVENGIDGQIGRFLEVRADAAHLHSLQLHDPATGLNHPLVSYRYDEAGNLAAVLDALDAARTFAYDGAHRMLRHTDRVGLSFHYTYDAQGRVVHAWGDGGLYDYRFVYDRLLRETEVTDSLGGVTRVKFDGNDLPLAEIDPLGGVTVFEYDEVGRTTAIVDPEGLRTEFAYDARGNMLTVLRPDGTRVEGRFDDDDQLICVVDRSGAAWPQSWDARGLLLTQATPLNSLARFDYDVRGQLILAVNPRGATTTLAFDRNGNLERVEDARGAVTRFGNDGLGRLLSRTDALGHITRYRYDRKGRLLGADLPGGGSFACDYDAEDRLVRFVDETGKETRLEYFGIGRLASRRQPDGCVVRYEYNTEELLTGIVNQRGERYAVERDALGRVASEIDYWGQRRRYHYDAASRLRRVDDPLERSIAFETDQLGRIVCKTFEDPLDRTQQVRETFKYGKNGQLVAMRNAHAEVTRRFDAEGRLIEEVQNGFRIENAYDAVGNRIRRKTSTGNLVEIEYDLGDQPVAIRIGDQAPIHIERDAVGRALRERLGLHLRRTCSYTKTGLLETQTVECDHAPLFDCRYDYDSLGNLVRRTDSGFGTDVYRYDPMGRVLEHLDPAGKLTHWLNDPAGDRLPTEVSESRARRVVGGMDEVEWSREGEYEGVRYAFDRAGNLSTQTKIREAGKPCLHLLWDANQRLRESRWERGARNGRRTKYGYDPLGRRTFKQDGDGTKFFFWDGDALLGELHVDRESTMRASHERIESKVVQFPGVDRHALAGREDFSKTREYVYRPGTLEPLAMLEPENAAPNTAGVRIKQQEPIVRAVTIRNEKTMPRPSQLPAKRFSLPADGIAKSSGMGSLGGRTALGVSGIKPEVVGNNGDPTGDQMPPASSSFGAAPAPPVLAPSLAPKPPDTARAPVAADEFAVPAPATSSLYFYFNDPNGSPTRMTTVDGEIVWAARAAVWGEITTPLVNQIAQPIRFQGQQYDEETGLHYNRYRYFDPHVGQFTGQDPLRIAAGSNFYRYAPNTLGWIDPMGLMPWNPGEPRPKGWRLPKNGTWEGDPGHSNFIPSDPESLGLKPGDKVPFVGGMPDFSQYATETIDVPGMTGVHETDMPLIHQRYADLHGLGNQTAGKTALSEAGMTPHHAGGTTVHIVPTQLHANVRHTGGASELREASSELHGHC